MKMDRHSGIGLGGLGGLLLAATVAGCAGGGDVSAGTDDSTRAGGEGRTARIINVEVERVEPREFTERIRITGEVRAKQDVTISAEESGPIRRIHVEKGTFVEEGRPLFEIDDSVLRPQVEEARARARLAAETWERRKRLYEEESALSELQYLEAKYAAEEAEARLAMLEARLAKTTIRAPISGVLEDRYVEVGSTVSPGTRVARMLDVGEVKISGGVPERYSGDIGPESEVRVVFDVLGGRSYPGEITYVGAAVDEQSRTFPIEVLIPNPEGIVKPRMVAELEVVRKRWEEAIAVPQEALIRVEDGFIVFVAAGEDGETVARTRKVETGPKAGNEVLVPSGLEAGDRLVVVGHQQVSAGDRVRIVNGEAGGGR